MVKQVPVPRHWLASYEAQSIDITSVNQDRIYRWDQEVSDLFTKHGLEPFRKLDIWNIDWSDYARQVQYPEPAEAYHDPRSKLEKLALTWLQNTQPQSLSLRIRILQNMLRILSG
jgi:hypothetical protein